MHPPHALFLAKQNTPNRSTAVEVGRKLKGGIQKRGISSEEYAARHCITGLFSINFLLGMFHAQASRYSLNHLFIIRGDTKGVMFRWPLAKTNVSTRLKLI
jgi:hypothetical protein